jgi:hypothetical protein
MTKFRELSQVQFTRKMTLKIYLSSYKMQVINLSKTPRFIKSNSKVY